MVCLLLAGKDVAFLNQQGNIGLPHWLATSSSY